MTCNHANLIEEHAKLKDEISLYVDTNQQLESLVTKYGLDYFPSDSSCEQASILEENVRLKNELAKSSMAQCENALDKILSIQRRGHLKEGLGYVAKPKKKNQKKKAKPAQSKKNNVVGGNATDRKSVV